MAGDVADPATNGYGIAAVASVSPNSTNEDAARSVANPRLQATAVAVADGVGSSERAGEAAEFVVRSVLEQFAEADRVVDLELLFRSTRDALNVLAGEEERPLEDAPDLLATTLVIAVEYPQYIDLAYVGNGAIWHIRGNFDHFHRTQYFPWSALNYLNPHTNQSRLGREVLYRAFAAGAGDDEVRPTVLRVTKDARYGDIVMLCTDGVYSFDQVRIGKLATDQSVWIPAEQTVIRLFPALKSFFQKSQQTSAALTSTLWAYLTDLADAQLIDDDASVGLLITPRALEYQRGSQVEP